MRKFELDLYNDEDSARWEDAFMRNGGFPSWIYCPEILKYYHVSARVDFKLWLLEESGLDLSACLLAVPQDGTEVLQIAPTLGSPYPCIFPKDVHWRRRAASASFDALLSHLGDGQLLYLTDFGQNLDAHEDIRWRILDYTSNYYVNRVMMVDLTLSAEDLEAGLHKYRKRDIKKTYRDPDITVSTVDHRDGDQEIEAAVETARHMHFLAAGRVTRPQASWDQTKQMVCSNRAAVTMLRYRGECISYLISFSQGDSYAVGASQANREEFRHLNPRHRLEWEVVLYYKARNFKTYEIGQRYVVSHPLRAFSEKEDQMTRFKERFGGYVMPRVHAWMAKDEAPLRAMWDPSRISFPADFGMSQD